MKKTLVLLVSALLLVGCAGGLPDIANLIATPTPPPPPDTPTVQPTVTLLPTIDLFVIPTSTPVTHTPTATSLIPDFPTQTLVPLPTFSEEFINDSSKVTFFVQNVGFRGILYSDPVLFWDEGACTTRRIKLTVFVEDPARTDRVYLFLRLRDKENTLNLSEWSAGAEMIKLDNGSFNYNIETHNLRRYYYYPNAWIEYQLVAVNENREIIGRTQLYDRNLSLQRCRVVVAP